VGGLSLSEQIDVLAGGELRHLFVFDLFEQVHGEFSIGCAMRRAAPTGV